MRRVRREAENNDLVLFCDLTEVERGVWIMTVKYEQPPTICFVAHRCGRLEIAFEPSATEFLFCSTLWGTSWNAKACQLRAALCTRRTYLTSHELTLPYSRSRRAPLKTTEGQIAVPSTHTISITFTSSRFPSSTFWTVSWLWSTKARTRFPILCCYSILIHVINTPLGNVVLLNDVSKHLEEACDGCWV